jgi:hypothetical protein
MHRSGSMPVGFNSGGNGAPIQSKGFGKVPDDAVIVGSVVGQSLHQQNQQWMQIKSVQKDVRPARAEWWLGRTASAKAEQGLGLRFAITASPEEYGV